MNKKKSYCFIYDSSRKYYVATQSQNGTYSILKSSQPKPLRFNPSNIDGTPLEFGTNEKYLSLTRSLSYPFTFIKDGAAILRNAYYLGKAITEDLYFTIIVWNGALGYYELGYNGKFDFSEKTEDPKSGTFTVPTIDDSAWGVLSENDSTVYRVDCSKNNPRSVPVLFDGITLLNKYTYQPVRTTSEFRYNYSKAVPFVLVNQDGDSVGIISKTQSSYDIYNADFMDYLRTSANYHFSSSEQITINVAGEISFIATNIDSGNGRVAYLLSFFTSKTTEYNIIPIFEPDTEGKIYKFTFDMNITLAIDEKLHLCELMAGLFDSHLNISYLTTKVIISTVTKADPVIRYGVRPLDLLKDIVSKATNGRYTIKSDYFTTNNKSILFSGDALRGIENAEIYTSFYDFFKSFNSLNFMALRVIKDELYIEKATEVYKQDTEIIDLGDCINLELVPAKDFYSSEIEVGSPRVDLRHPSGRLEFNSTNTFSLRMKGIDKKLDLVTKYRTGCYDIQFLIQDYNAESTKDNSGDKSVFIVDITDEKAVAVADINTYQSVTVNNATLSPVIKYPLNNEVINYNKPTLRGIGIPGNNVNIYIDDVLDGTAVIDGNGNWTYEVNTALIVYNPGIESGIHVIKATYTDLVATYDTISVMIDTLYFTQSTLITYPQTGESLYNNKPLIKGKAPAGTNIDISIDGVLVGSVVTDNSCGWQFKSPVIANGSRVISINALISSVSIDVDTNVEYPLITYIGSELDGFLIVNNLPLIEGVAKPGTVLQLWLDYIKYVPLGAATADANGNWSYQTVPVNYIDPTGATIVLAPIKNGANIVSTLLVNNTVGINIRGYKLNRPAFSSITGVVDNTVFNVNFSPKRMLNNWKPMLAAMMNKQRGESIIFETADKNPNLLTVLGTEIISERANIAGTSLGQPILIPEYAIAKVRAKSSFAKTLYNFYNGGTVVLNYRGLQIEALPIGSMKMSNIHDSVQEWKLILSPSNSYQALLNLYKNGTTITLMKNALFHSDYNTLHFVKYNYTPNVKYKTKNMYEDWFNNRNDFWSDNPDYIQKMEVQDPLRDQIITNGISNATLNIYRCSDAELIDTIDYNPVASPPIPIPDIVLEAVVDMSIYPKDQYFFVIKVGSTEVMISERVETRTTWDKTILIESGSSINLPAWFPSTGARCVLRVEGLIKKLQPVVSTIIAKEEDGDNENVYASVGYKHMCRFGTAYGLPDYLYAKVALALALDELMIEGKELTLDVDEKITPSDDVNGHPLYYYNVNLLTRRNDLGVTVEGAPGGVTEGVVLVVDAEAVGLPAGSLVDIEVTN